MYSIRYLNRSKTTKLIIITKWICDEDDDGVDCLNKFPASYNDESVYIDEKGHFSITKKYKMQRFSTKSEADNVYLRLARQRITELI